MSWKKRLSRFSLRFFLILITIFCVWFAIISDRAKKQKRMVEKLNEFGAEVLYDYQFKLGKKNLGMSPSIPEWMINGVGIDMFHSVVYVDLREKELDPSNELYLVGPLIRPVINFFGEGEFMGDLCDKCPRIESLKVSRRFAGDLALEKVGGLKSLKRLMVEKTSNVTDKGIESLKGCRQLEVLFLNGDSELSDRSLAAIGTLKNLEKLSLHSSLITDDGVKHLQNLRRLEYLRLYPNGRYTSAVIPGINRMTPKSGESQDAGKTNLTDRSLETISQMESVNDLWLGMQELTEEGVQQLASLETLENLRLNVANNSNVWLNKETWDLLAGLPLKFIGINTARFPKGAAEEFLRLNPSCKIHETVVKDGYTTARLHSANSTFGTPSDDPKQRMQDAIDAMQANQ